jgi:hypothetical protein
MHCEKDWEGIMPRFQWLCISIIALLIVTQWAPAAATNPIVSETISQPPNAPFLGNYIEVWQDAIGNTNQELIYNPVRDEFLAVWTSNQNASTQDAWARRISASGALLDGFAVASFGGLKFIEADVAYNPTSRQYLVVLTSRISDSDYDIVFVYFDDDGTDKSGLNLLDTDMRIQQHPSVTYNSIRQEYLVVYENKKSDGYIETVARRIRGSDCSPIGTGRTVIASVGANQYRHTPAVAYNPARDNYLVAYMYEYDGSPLKAYIANKTVSYDLATVGPEVNLNSVFGMGVDVALSNDQYLVSWGPPSYEINARRVNYDGQPFGAGGGFRLTLNSCFDCIAILSKIGFTQNMGYWIVWERFLTVSAREADILGNIVFPGRDQAVGPEFIIEDSVNYQGAPAIACRPYGPCLVTWSNNLDNYPLGDTDIRGRLLNLQSVYLPAIQK